jgi:hypothetical protein
MREWLCKIICGSTQVALELPERAFEDDLTTKITDIKKRIATLERTIGRRTKSNSTSQTQSDQILATQTGPKVEVVEPSNKDKELADIKAKLLGKK